jgi:uncharacterized phage-associated protein
MPYDAKAVANYFLWKPVPGERITQMKLHKLLYYAHGWHLGFGRGPLLDEMVEAWAYGPVVPSVYHEFKDLGSAPIDREATILNPRTLDLETPEIDTNDHSTLALLDRVLEVYGGLSAVQLSAMTHAAGSPWSEMRRKYPNIKSVDIPNDVIEHHFKQRLRTKQNG